MLVRDTPTDVLSDIYRTANHKGTYPVYLTGSGDGIRGVNYRSRETLGVCMLILSPFNNRRERHQALKRVGRYNDDCYRIQNSESAEVDHELDKSFKLKLKNELRLLEKAMEEDVKNDHQPLKCQT